MTAVPEILNKILTHKRAEVEERQARISLDQMKEWAADAGAIRPFAAMLAGAVASGRPAVIAEIKRASPSRGILRENFNPMELARSYQMAGASCLSVLTDQEFFKGSGPILELAKKACALPILRKDFIIDPYQVFETKVMGGDCMLLIVAALSDEQLVQLYELGKELRLDILVEVHDADEMARALRLKPVLLGINNRNLHTFEISLDTTLRLLENIPDDCHVVTESGIHSPEDVKLMKDHGVHTFLVGEAFMVAEDPGEKLKELFF